MTHIFEFLYFPPSDLAQRGIDQADLFMAGEAKMDKPLAVKGLSHLLQDLDPAYVVFDKVVVGGENGGNFALGG